MAAPAGSCRRKREYFYDEISRETRGAVKSIGQSVLSIIFFLLMHIILEQIFMILSPVI
jgi:hypothetical protein